MIKFLKKFLITMFLILSALSGQYCLADEIQDELLNIPRKQSAAAAKITTRSIENENIKDELIDNINSLENALKLRATKFNIYNDKIKDELVDEDFVAKNHAKDGNGARNPKIEDDFIKKALKYTKITAVRTKTKYDFSKKQIPVQIKIDKNFKANKHSKEGDYLSFSTINDYILGKIKLPKGTKIEGRVETISASDKMGVPESVIVDNFFVKENPNIVFFGNIKKTGSNRSIWVYPLYQAGNIVLYVAGFVFVPIHGGHAKFSTNETYTVYYENTEAAM